MEAVDGPSNILIDKYKSMNTQNQKMKKYLYESKEPKQIGSRSKNRTPLKSSRAQSRRSAESMNRSQFTDMTNKTKKKKKKVVSKPGRQC